MTDANLRDWVVGQLEAAKDHAYLLLRDPSRLLPENDGALSAFATENGYTLIRASTNLVFRELYEKARRSPDVKKLLVWDRMEQRLAKTGPLGVQTSAPPPFYPDFLATVRPEARIELDLRQFLKEATGDSLWPAAANEPAYARIIKRNLSAVLRAHQGLRAVNQGRFTDSDFHTIVAFAALGVPESAFKRLGAEDYWKIGLLGHQALEELDTIVPVVTKQVKDDLKRAPAPFSWLADQDPERVIRAFYLAVILSQHSTNWKLLIPVVDPDLAGLTQMPEAGLSEAAEKLVRLDRVQASRDLGEVERGWSRDGLQELLYSHLKWTEIGRVAQALENERYSTLIRSLALMMALGNLMSNAPNREAERRVAAVLFADAEAANATPTVPFVDARESLVWTNLKEAYRLARSCLSLRGTLQETIKALKVTKTDQLTFDFFRAAWNEKQLNRVEYYLSSLERLVDTAELLPSTSDELPAAFDQARRGIRQRVLDLAKEVDAGLDELNRRFQELVKRDYATWVQNDGSLQGAPILTAQFLRFCLKRYWDPKNEKAVLLIFDGMRYDIWDELLRPALIDRMEVLADLPASSLLPSETHVTRKAISAGTFPDQFDMDQGEDKLLKQGLLHAIDYKGPVDTLAPDTAGTGETVRYRAGNLDVYIFELCDKELHRITLKTLPDKRQVPSRPLAFVYEQSVKNVLDTEVMAILRKLEPGTKVFVTADHGFGRIHRDILRVEMSWLNQPDDCSYQNAWLRKTLSEGGAPAKVRDNVYEFSVADLRMPKKISAVRSGETQDRTYASLIFPKVGYALARPNAQFRPDAYSHGGISIQELMIPMVVLRVQPQPEGLVILSDIAGPGLIVEGEEAIYHFNLRRTTGQDIDDVRVQVEAMYSAPPRSSNAPDQPDEPAKATVLSQQVLLATAAGVEAELRVKPAEDEATADERRAGELERLLTVTASYRDGRRTLRKTRVFSFKVQLNSDRIVRRVGNLGNILGLTPKSIRG